MKIITAAICANCDEIYDTALYRVCPACASDTSMFISKFLGTIKVVDEPGDKIPTALTTKNIKQR
jgi:RNA polymerase subunit RPABC4/transcription elongation factor Spt4